MIILRYLLLSLKTALGEALVRAQNKKKKIKNVKQSHKNPSLPYAIKIFRRFYGNITGNQLPVHFPLFFMGAVNIYRNQQCQQSRIGQLLLSSYSPSTLQVFLSAIS